MKRRIISNLWWLLPLLALMAFIMQGVIQSLVVMPFAYLFFRLKLYYRSIPEPISWAVVTSIVGIFALGSLTGGFRRRHARIKPIPPQKGPVETLAQWMNNTRKSNYFKWAVANRLGKLALTYLHGDDPKGSRKLEGNGRGWNPSKSVQTYLQAGLERPFIEYSRKRFAVIKEKTPFDDVPVSDVVDYLESQME